MYIGLKDDNDVRICDAQTASYINDYYVEIGARLAAAFQGNGNLNVNLLVVPVDTVFSLKSLDMASTVKLIGTIKTSKSSGIDHIRANVIKDVLIAKPVLLRCIVNLSLLSGSLPDVFKCACVIPLPKSGDLSRVTNW